MRCALIEYNHYHEETLPTFVRLLNELGIEPDVYMTRRSRRRQPFGLANELRYREHRVERLGWLRGLAFRARRYELVIVNSMEPVENVQRAAATMRPLLGVMHNTELLSSEADYRDFFTGPRRLPLVLGRHIATYFARAGQPLLWIAHVHFGQVARMRAAGGATTFAVSGNVEFSRRNYDSLLDAVAELVAEGTPVRIRIIGRSTSRDGLTLRADIERRGLADAFELSSSEVSHPEFFQRFADCDFVLPLIDHSAERLQAYLESKLASSIPFAVGLGVPLVLHRDLAAAYGVEPCGIGYVDGGLAEAMRTAIASGDADRGRWQAALATTRTELLAESLGNLHEAISAVAS